MAENQSKITKASTILLYGTSVLFDLIQFLIDLLHFIPFVGNFIAFVINFFIDMGALLTFYLMFKTRGVSFVRGRRAMAFFGGFVLDLIPFINSFAWTLDVFLVITDVKVEERLAKLPGETNLAEAAQKLPGRGGGAVGRREIPAPTNVIQHDFRQNSRPLPQRSADVREDYRKAA